MSSLVGWVLVLAVAGAQEPEGRPRDYWEAIVESGYVLPAGESAYELIVDASRHLGSPDSELRESVAYGLPAVWLQRQGLLDAIELLALMELWTGNLGQGLGGRGDDTVLLRSFSALSLALLAVRDEREPFLEAESFASLLRAALDYLAAERDLRGWGPEVGWMHSAAHTADLLGALAASRHLRPEGQREILAGIARRLAETEGHVFVHGEEDRLAAAVLAILERDDTAPGSLQEFVDALASSARRARAAGRFEPALFAGQQNSKNCLRSLFVSLSGIETPSDEQAELRRSVLRALARM